MGPSIRTPMMPLRVLTLFASLAVAGHRSAPDRLTLVQKSRALSSLQCLHRRGITSLSRMRFVPHSRGVCSSAHETKNGNKSTEGYPAK